MLVVQNFQNEIWVIVDDHYYDREFVYFIIKRGKSYKNVWMVPGTFEQE